MESERRQPGAKMAILTGGTFFAVKALTLVTSLMVNRMLQPEGRGRFEAALFYPTFIASWWQCRPPAS